jgi:hypothetical protein
MDKRVILRVEVSAAAREGLIAARERFGMKNVSVASRMMHWLVEQDEATRAMILGIYPHSFTPDEPGRRALKHIAKGGE